MTYLLLILLILGAAWPWVDPDRRYHRAAAPKINGSTKNRKSNLTTDDVDTAVVLDLAAAALHSGLSVPDTLKSLASATTGLGQPRVSDEFARAARGLDVGAPWQDCWAGASASAQPLRDCLHAAWVDGIDPVPLLSRASKNHRDSRTESAKEAAEKLGVRLVIPLGVCYLPAFVLVGIVPVILSASFDLLGR